MRALVVIWFAVWASPALGHGAELHGSKAAWTFDPWIVVPLGVLGLLYGVGWSVLWRHTASGRKVRAWQTLAYIAGWMSLAVALVSPLHWLGEHLFTFHMIEHEIVMAISAPLLVMARPMAAFLWSLPQTIRIQVGRVLQRSAVKTTWRLLSSGRNATLLHGIAIWIWHVPLFFDAAVVSVSVHRLQHLSFLLTAILFWWSIFRRSDGGVGAWHLFVTMLHTSILGALMALAPRVLYEAQTAAAMEWGLTPLEDQQLAGLIMWVPAGTVYAAVALVLTALWIRNSGTRQERVDAINTV